MQHDSEADKWCRVQVLFKNKPSESTDNPNTKERNRASHAFGMPYADFELPGFPFCASVFTGKALVLWDTYWKVIKGDGSETREHCMTQNVYEPVKKGEFLKRVCREHGIFGSTDGGNALLEAISMDSGNVCEESSIHRRLRWHLNACSLCSRGARTVMAR